MPATRIVAKPEALNAASWPADALVLRIAQDEVLVLPPVDSVKLVDEHAIVVTDTGFAGVWLAKVEAEMLLERVCDWELPKERPAFAQGAIAGIPAKVWLETERVLIMVPAAYTHDFEERTA
jgi:hypothetical protein